MTNTEHKTRTLEDDLLREPVTEYTIASTEGFLVARAPQRTKETLEKGRSAPPSTADEMKEKLGWSLDDLKRWYQAAILNAAGLEARVEREGSYERFTYAFHVGLKLCEHWEPHRDTVFVYSLSEKKAQRKPSELLDLLVDAARVYVREHLAFPYLTEEFDVSLLWNDLSQSMKYRLIDYMSEYLDAPPSFLHPMSENGKSFLVGVYQLTRSSGKDWRGYRREITRVVDPPRYLKDPYPALKDLHLYLLPAELASLVD